LDSVLRGDGDALNVLGGIPTVATDYSPFWDFTLGKWTDFAVKAGYRDRWYGEFQVWEISLYSQPATQDAGGPITLVPPGFWTSEALSFSDHHEVHPTYSWPSDYQRGALQ
jgi:hypothetical protein